MYICFNVNFFTAQPPPAKVGTDNSMNGNPGKGTEQYEKKSFLLA
jgi:hypothetical protein